MRAAALLALLLLAPGALAEDEPEPKRPDPKELEIQVARLKDAAPSFRERAARWIGQWGPGAKSAVPALLPLVQDADAPVRRAAAFALARMGRAGAAGGDALAAAFPKEEDAGARANMAWALGAVGESSASGALAKAVKEGDPAVRLNAARALGDLGVPDGAAFSALSATLKDPDWTLRVTAAWALGVPRDKSKGAVPALARLLADESETVRAMAARALGRIGEDDKVAEPALLRALQAEIDRKPPAAPKEDKVLLDRLAKEGGARRNIVWALGRYGARSKDAKALLESLKEKDSCPAVRSAAQTALERTDATILPAALEEKAREIPGDPKAPWRMAVAGGCLEVVFRHEK